MCFFLISQQLGIFCTGINSFNRSWRGFSRSTAVVHSGTVVLKQPWDSLIEWWFLHEYSLVYNRNWGVNKFQNHLNCVTSSCFIISQCLDPLFWSTASHFGTQSKLIILFFLQISIAISEEKHKKQNHVNKLRIS